MARLRLARGEVSVQVDRVKAGSLARDVDHVVIEARNVDSAFASYMHVLGCNVTLYKQIGTTKDYAFKQFMLSALRVKLIKLVSDAERFLTSFLQKQQGLSPSYASHLYCASNQIFKSKGLRIADEFMEDPVWRTVSIYPTGLMGF